MRSQRLARRERLARYKEYDYPGANPYQNILTGRYCPAHSSIPFIIDLPSGSAAGNLMQGILHYYIRSLPFAIHLIDNETDLSIFESPLPKRRHRSSCLRSRGIVKDNPLCLFTGDNANRSKCDFQDAHLPNLHVQ